MKPHRILLAALAVLSISASAQPKFRFDSINPGVHDPVMAYENGKYYIFATGMGIDKMSSTDLKSWTKEKPAFEKAPQWACDLIPGYKGHTWAPDIIRHGDKWYLYYSCSAFGKNTSAIGVTTNKTLDPDSPDYKWEDLGLVVRSIPGSDNWNAIDPNLVFDENGNPWLSFGSFWDGIQLVRLDNDMKTPVGKPVTIARRKNPVLMTLQDKESNNNAIEAPFIVHHDGYYYLFVSYDLCCRGLKSNYKTAVGRSKTIDGPYIDKEGKEMATGGGTVIAEGDDSYAGIGHCSVYDFDGKWWFVAHAYDKNRHGGSKLFLRKLEWKDGWPEIVKQDVAAL